MRFKKLHAIFSEILFERARVGAASYLVGLRAGVGHGRRGQLRVFGPLGVEHGVVWMLLRSSILCLKRGFWVTVNGTHDLG